MRLDTALVGKFKKMKFFLVLTWQKNKQFLNGSKEFPKVKDTTPQTHAYTLLAIITIQCNEDEWTETGTDYIHLEDVSCTCFIFSGQWWRTGWCQFSHRQNRKYRVSKGGHPLGSGFPIRASSTLLAHHFASQSVVCYTHYRRCCENTVAYGACYWIWNSRKTGCFCGR